MEQKNNAIFNDTNAYIQNWNNGPNKPQFKPNKNPCCPKKVVFQEPYECLPDFYIDNNFKKGNCSCIPKPKPKCPPPKPPCQPQNFGFNFDLKNLLPLLSGLMKGGNGTNFSNIISMLNNGNNGSNEANSNLDFSTLLYSLSNSGGLGNILNLFKPKTEKQTSATDFWADELNKSNDLEIKNYTRVE